MFNTIVRQLNWVDFLLLIICLRICYVGINHGLVSEFFKTLGTLCAIYLSLHYYTQASDIIRVKFNAEFIPLRFLDFICFLVICCLAYLLFVLLLNVIRHFISSEGLPALNKWGGFIFSLVRAYLFIALFIFAMVISSVGYLFRSVNSSYLGPKLVMVSPSIYNSLWQGFFSKFMTGEDFNHTVLEEVDLETAEGQ